MELPKVFALLVLILMALVHSSIASSPLLEEEEDDLDVSGDDQEDFGNDFVLRSSDDSPGRFMLGRKNSLVLLTCNKFPRICLLKGGPRRHCCQKKCVNLLGDRLNCGKCGRKCKYGYICCRGKCVNPSVSKKHCGGCNQGCDSGGFCAFGLCNYA